MSIIENVRKRKAELLAQREQGNEAPINENRARAVLAIEGGINSLAWEDYMKQFADPNTPEQLERLKGTDGTHDDFVLATKRVYVVAGAVCGPPTLERLDFSVDTIDLPPGVGDFSPCVLPNGN